MNAITPQFSLSNGGLSFRLQGSSLWAPISVPMIVPSQLGAIADFNGTTGTDNTAILNACFAASKILNIPIYLDTLYYCVSPIAALSNFDVMIYGPDRGVGGLVFGPNAAGGLAISQDDYRHVTRVQDIGIYTIGQEEGIGLSIAYAPADSLNNRTVPRCRVSNLEVRGYDVLNHGWATGVDTMNVHVDAFDHIHITGRRDTSKIGLASFANMTNGFTLRSATGLTAIPSDQLLECIHVYNSLVGILGNADVEGASITGCKLVGVGTGVLWQNQSVRPGLQIYGNHINCFTAGMDVTNTPQAQISGNLIYKFEQATTRTVGIRMTTSDNTQIGTNTFVNSATDSNVSGDFDCVEIASSVDCVVDRQMAARPTRIVLLSGGTTGTDVADQKFSGVYLNAAVQADYIDTSTGSNSYAGSIAHASNAAAVNVGSALTSVLTNIPLPRGVIQGERYLVTANITLVKGATAGDVAVTINKSAGTANLAFDDTGSQFIERRNAVGSGSSSSLTLAGEIGITGSGTLQLSLNALSVGSDSTVSVGSAQMTVTRL